MPVCVAISSAFKPAFARKVRRSVSSWGVTRRRLKFTASRANSNLTGVSIHGMVSSRQSAFSPLRWNPSMMFPFASLRTGQSSPRPCLDWARLYSMISSSCWVVWGFVWG